ITTANPPSSGGVFALRLIPQQIHHTLPEQKCQLKFSSKIEMNKGKRKPKPHRKAGSEKPYCF
ncbi:MAG: hypothetical protein ABF430_10385, partial [Acetobacter persici]|uniref:hypothetical protein n=1 Tax=Acetobacter persici TaxID=1076596 RepID=UPI0039EB12BA